MRVTLAVGSFDDVTDMDSTTPAGSIARINHHVTETSIKIAADGKASLESVKRSEPFPLVGNSYDQGNTLHEKNPGGRIVAGRWQSPR